MANLQTKTAYMDPCADLHIRPDSGYIGMQKVDVYSTWRDAWGGVWTDYPSYIPTVYDHALARICLDSDFEWALEVNVEHFMNANVWRPFTETAKNVGSLYLYTWNPFSLDDIEIPSGLVWRLEGAYQASSSIGNNILGHLRTTIDPDTMGCILKFVALPQTNSSEAGPITYTAYFINTSEDPSLFWLLGVSRYEDITAVAFAVMEPTINDLFDGAEVALLINSAIL